MMAFHIRLLQSYCFYLYFFFLLSRLPSFSFFFFFNDTATTEIYTLSLHDALPIFEAQHIGQDPIPIDRGDCFLAGVRSEEHTSELQSQSNLVCRLLLEKKKKKHKSDIRCRTAEIPYQSHTSIDYNDIHGLVLSRTA